MYDQLRIVFVTNNYTPYSGGVVSSINAWTQELQNRGHQVSIITLDFLGAAHNDPDYVFRIPCPIRFLYKNNHMALPMRAYTHMRKLIEQLQPNIIHSHHPFLLGRAALKSACNQSIPIVFTYHSLYEQWTHVIPLPQLLTRPLIKSYVRHYCKKVDGIIAPSSIVKKNLQNQGIECPMEVIPSCLQSVFSPRDSFYPKIRSADQPFHLFSVTRCSKEKNPFFLLELIAALNHVDKSFKMTIAGYGTLWKSMHVYAYETLKLTPDQLKFVHQPSKEHIANLYREADLFIFSSQVDTQVIVLDESMAACKPVIALDGPGQQDIVKDSINGFIVKDLQEMIEKVLLIAHDITMHEKMQQKAWHTAHNYKPEILIPRLLAFYKSILEG